MNTNINSKGRKRFVPWTAVVSLLAAIVLVAPTVVFAQITGQLSQDCDFALIGTEHTITATVTEDGAPGASGLVYFNSSDNKYFGVASFDENGVATFPGPDDPPYQVDSVGQLTITLFAMDSNYNLAILDTITTSWTDDEAKLCSEDPPAAASVTVGGRITLNAKKNGTFSIALCSVDGLEVKDVDLKTVRLAGVAPWHWKYKDSRLCPDGKDGSKDLVFKFKNREVVKALMKNNQVELADDKAVDLVLTGSMKDGTSFDGKWEAVILKEEGKMPWKASHNQKKDKRTKECKK
jgi:hypothetical protein